MHTCVCTRACTHSRNHVHTRIRARTQTGGQAGTLIHALTRTPTCRDTIGIKRRYWYAGRTVSVYICVCVRVERVVRYVGAHVYMNIQMYLITSHYTRVI